MEIGIGAKGRTCTTTNLWPTDDELRNSRSVLRGCLARELVNGRRRRAVWRGNDWPRGKECRETKFPEKKKMIDLAFCITVGDHPILALPFLFGGLQFA